MQLAARASMLIRRPPKVVFKAFIDPEITSHFWFSRGSAPLIGVGQRVEWTWEPLGISLQARVLEFDIPRSIRLEYPLGRGLQLSFICQPMGTEASHVEMVQFGYADDRDSVHDAIIGTERLALVLAGAKAWLEHGIELNLGTDRYPYATFSY